jgi:hypothetical protein
MATAFFFQRLNDHIQYVRKIQKTLRGDGDFQGSDHQSCKLGQWLYGDGRKEAEAIGEDAVRKFEAILDPHQAFHDASAQALAAKASGDDATAQAKITEMDKLSVILIRELTALDDLAK